MKDAFGRTVDYLRISLTDKCNLRCRYCIPKEGVALVPHKEILTFEEIEKFARVTAGLGLKKIRFTGGEPLVRRDAEKLVAALAKIPGIEELCLTTNGLLFCERAEALKAAGLNRVNFSLDSVDEETFYKITGAHGAAEVLKAVDRALELGFVVKINCVAFEWNKDQLCKVALLAKEKPMDVRFIELMPIGCAREMPGLSIDFVLRSLEEAFGKAQECLASPRSPARLYQFKGFEGRIGLITPMSRAFCDSCGRLRLTSDGMLKACLCDESFFDIKKILRSGKDDAQIKGALQEEICKALASKPKAGALNLKQKSVSKLMSEIGG